MKKLIYIEENFISLDECQKFIDLSKSNKKEISYVMSEQSVEHPYITHLEWKNHGASYYNGDEEVVTRVNSICKNFDSNANLDYVGVVRWPIGTFMKPHVDDKDTHKPDMFAAMLYLNSNFSGGYTCFENFEVKPETGKLIVFSNSQYLHYVSEVKDAERFVLSFWYNSLNK